MGQHRFPAFDHGLKNGLLQKSAAHELGWNADSLGLEKRLVADDGVVRRFHILADQGKSGCFQQGGNTPGDAGIAAVLATRGAVGNVKLFQFLHRWPGAGMVFKIV